MKLPKITLHHKPTYIKFAEDVDFFELFGKIEQEFDTCFLFESLGEQGKLSRYSLIGFDPTHIIRAKGKTLFFDDQGFKVENPYLALREIVPQNAISRQYAGGLIGYLGYDAVNYFEPTLSVKTHGMFAQFCFGVYLDGFILDKQTHEVFYFYYDKNRMRTVREVMGNRGSKGPSTSLRVNFQRDTLTKEQHAQLVEKVKEEIRAGNTFQAQIGFKKEFKITGDTLGIYGKLRTVNPSPFMYYMRFGGIRVIGASPELLFKLQNGEMETYPLAGTIRRGKTEAEDTELARELLNDPKEIAEHNMLVDLHRNDIGRVAQFGSVKVRHLREIKKFSHVQHIASEIAGILKDGEDMFSSLASNFPAGTLSGAPKIESIKIIDRLEPDARGPYGGAIGHFGFNGDCTFAIAIRSLFISGAYGYIQASGGIVYDSVAENEYDEVERKLAGMEAALQV